ncbi:MAG: DUF2851 family protein [Tunicatimonas sp.]
MREELLYFIWTLQYFSKQALTTEDGHTVTIVHPGVRNLYSGPDFADARVRLAEIAWGGAVEIHLNASDWNAHGHQHDPAYNNVILHVVWHADQVVHRQDGTPMPTLVLENRVAPSIIDNYRQLVFHAPEQQDIACAPLLPNVDELQKLTMLDKTAVLRLERKSQEILERVDKNRGDWLVTAYQALFQSFGFRVNQAPFEQLSRVAPPLLVAKYQSDFTSVAALLLGQAGLLEGEDWPDAWINAYEFLRVKHQLNKNALARSQWRFFRTRPANFPTVRIVQLAAVLVGFHQNLLALFESESAAEQCALVKQTQRVLPESVPPIGKESIHKILINAVVPYQFAYGSYFREQSRKDQALTLLQSLPAENNSLVKKYRGYGYPISSALDTQAVLELHHSFCKPKQCLLCAIGSSIIKTDNLFVTSGPH